MNEFDPSDFRIVEFEDNLVDQYFTDSLDELHFETGSEDILRRGFHLFVSIFYSRYSCLLLTVLCTAF